MEQKKVETLQVVLGGTRGSLPTSGKEFIEYGGNTTSIQVLSRCLPEDHFLVVDAGSGYRVITNRILAQQGAKIKQTVVENHVTKGLTKVNLFFTHFHPDHTHGLPISALTHIPEVDMHVFGPGENKYGPKENMKIDMGPQRFPVLFERVKSHFSFKAFDHPDISVVVIHPIGGLQVISIGDFDVAMNMGGTLNIGTGDKKGKFNVNECLVIRMYKSNHPEQTISYRFEERPTGRVFVFLTDHENLAADPADLRNHVKGAHLLVQDGQYTEAGYKKATPGFGHGTGPYCVRLAWENGVHRLGLTHHDPNATDAMVKEVLAEAHGELARLIGLEPKESKLRKDNVFACADEMTITV